MNKTCKIVIGVVCLFVHNLAFSQDFNIIDDKTIVMTEGELTQLVETIKKHRREKIVVNNVPQHYNSSSQNFETTYLEKKIEELQWQLNKLNSTKQNRYEAELASTSDLQNAKDQISDLRQKLYALEAARTNVHVAPTTITDTIVVANNTNNNEILGFSKKLDSLQLALNAQKPVAPISYQNNFDVLKNKLGELQSEMASGNTKPSSYDQLKSKYKGYKQELLFADNSTAIKGTTKTQVDELFNLLNNNDNLDVVLKGFASAKGSAIYNEKLSMDRTESVKKALVLQGVHPTRVLTQYHGIDYKAISAETARRVEATILVRNRF